MPKYELTQNPAVSNAIEEIIAYMRTHRHTQSYIASKAGVSQPQIAKILGGKVKKASPDFMRLCDYAGVKLDSSPKAPHLHPRIQAAINKVWDGRDETIEVIAKLIECADIARGKKISGGRERKSS